VVNLENSLPTTYFKKKENHDARRTNFCKQINYLQIRDSEKRAIWDRVLLSTDWFTANWVL